MPIIDQTVEKTVKQLRLKELNFGDTVRVMPLTVLMSSTAFSYPAYKPDLKDKDKMLDDFAIFNATPTGGIMSAPEKAMIEIWQAARDNLVRAVKARAQKRGKIVDANFDKIEAVVGDKKKTWGFGFSSIGIQVVERGNICDMQLTDGQAKAISVARSRLIGGNLEYTPLLCWLAITIEEGKEFFNTYTKKKEKSKALKIEVIEVEKGCKGILPAAFGGCVTVHPEDMPQVRDWVKAYHKAVLDFSEIPTEPAYRDYPDENGEVCYVATKSVQDPVRLNVFKMGVSETLVKAISEREALYQYKPATAHSLLGGYYYATPTGARRPVALDEIRAGYVRSEDGVAVVAVDGQERQILWLKGSLWQKKFNPLLVDASEKYAFEDSNPEELETLAKKLGIPVKGDTDPQPITDWDAFLSQSAAMPSRTAPVANM